MRRGIVGLKVEGRLKLLHGLVDLAGLHQLRAKVVVGHPGAGVLRDGASPKRMRIIGARALPGGQRGDADRSAPQATGARTGRLFPGRPNAVAIAAPARASGPMLARYWK